MEEESRTEEGPVYYVATVDVGVPAPGSVNTGVIRPPLEVKYTVYEFEIREDAERFRDAHEEVMQTKIAAESLSNPQDVLIALIRGPIGFYDRKRSQEERIAFDAYVSALTKYDGLLSDGDSGSRPRIRYFTHYGSLGSGVHRHVIGDIVPKDQVAAQKKIVHRV